MYSGNTSLDTTPYRSLDFWVNGGPIRRTAASEFFSGSNDVYQTKCNLPALATDNQWHEINIPLSSLIVPGQSVDYLDIADRTGTTTTLPYFYVDNIVLLGTATQAQSDNHGRLSAKQLDRRRHRGDDHRYEPDHRHGSHLRRPMRGLSSPSIRPTQNHRDHAVRNRRSRRCLAGANAQRGKPHPDRRFHVCRAPSKRQSRLSRAAKRFNRRRHHRDDRRHEPDDNHRSDVRRHVRGVIHGRFRQSNHRDDCRSRCRNRSMSWWRPPPQGSYTLPAAFTFGSPPVGGRHQSRERHQGRRPNGDAHRLESDGRDSDLRRQFRDGELRDRHSGFRRHTRARNRANSRWR